VTDTRKPYEVLAGRVGVEPWWLKRSLEELDLYVCSGEALAEVLELAVRQGATDAELHTRTGVARLIRLVLVGSS
jgi:hypothetical protein